MRATGSGVANLGTVDGSIASQGGLTTARGISADGSIVVGYGLDASSTYRVFRWTQAGMVDVSNGQWSGFGRGCSPDGNVIVGSRSTTGVSLAFKWTQTGGVVDLGTLPGFDSSAGLDATSDGGRVCGLNLVSTVSGSQRAAIWDQDVGWRSIMQILSDAGVNMVGWNLTFAMSMSDDGTVITGYGINPSGNTEAWVATIPRVAPACPADLDNGSGNGTPDGGVDISDLLYFLARFEVGC
jgi:probable HAF family extracellular repeat protein